MRRLGCLSAFCVLLSFFGSQTRSRTPCYSRLCSFQQLPGLRTHRESRLQMKIHHDCTSPLLHAWTVSHTRCIHKHRFPSPYSSRPSSPPPRGQFRSDRSPYQLNELGPSRTYSSVGVRVGTYGLERELDIVPVDTFDAPSAMDMPKDM